MGDKSPKNTNKAKKQKDNKKAQKATANTGAQSKA